MGLAALLAATFPGGSVTGAPKIAAVDLIASSSRSARASMGSLGRVHGNGDLELALTIRTFAIADGLVHLWVGGGIVGLRPARRWRSLTSGAASGRDRRPRTAATGGHADGRAPVSRRPLAAAISGRGVVDAADAVVACDDDGFARGRAAFETLRVRRSAVPACTARGSAARLGRTARAARAAGGATSGRSRSRRWRQAARRMRSCASTDSRRSV